MMKNIHYKGRHFNRLRKHPQLLMNRERVMYSKNPLYLITIYLTKIQLPEPHIKDKLRVDFDEFYKKTKACVFFKNMSMEDKKNALLLHEEH